MRLETGELNRRGIAALQAASASGVIAQLGGLVVPVQAASPAPEHKSASTTKTKTGHDSGGGNEDVSATEDLMREHGVLRRTLNVYAEIAGRLRTSPETIDAHTLADAATLFREFGEDYHERTLEEQFIFPEVRQIGGPNEKLVEVLLIQHQRGREITDYLQQIGRSGTIGRNGESVAAALAAMARMYNAHSAWEDTVVFQVWKKRQSRQRLHELAEKFEEIEHEQFGKDGFDDAVGRIARIEELFGLADLGHYTAPAPERQ